MKVFVSYSFQDSELYVITLLFEQLRKNGFNVDSSDFSNYGLYNNYKISESDFFIGIITNNSETINEVIQQWQVAANLNKQTILLIEDNVHIQDVNAIKFIRFNRYNPQTAISQLFSIPARSLPAITPSSKVNKEVENAVAAGLIIVGLAALISILSGSNK